MGTRMSRYQSIVVLTGAGVSAESGIKTFRDNNGLWENHRVEDVCTPEAFARKPELVQQFYNARRRQLVAEAKPNPAHLALAEFEQRFKGEFTLVTQNVDDLHERAGSLKLLHMHGELLKARCNQTHKMTPWNTDITASTPCPCCGETGRLRPHIVWFGEIPLYMDEIESALSRCDLFVSIGTSGQVYPAAGFVQMASKYGAHTVELNLEPSAGRTLFAEHHYGPASHAVAAYFAQLV
jgi:NAD-dependent deacetylase